MHLFPELDDESQKPVTRKGAGKIITGDARTELANLKSQTFQSCITSPPYWGLRDYGVEGQVGAEMILDDYLHNLVAIFSEVRRVLSDDGTLWLVTATQAVVEPGGKPTRKTQPVEWTIVHQRRKA